MSVTRWRYKGTTQEHISPYADDFKNFGLIIDLIGVLYASVRDLDMRNKELESELKALNGQIQVLQTQINSI